MTREFLKDLGLEKETIDKILSQYGQDINSVKSELSVATEKLTEQANQLEKFKDYDEIKSYKTKFESLAAKYDKDIAESNKKLEKSELDNIVIDKLYRSGIINPSLVRGSDKINGLFTDFDGDKDKFSANIDSAISDLKESDSYLFKSTPSTEQVGLNNIPAQKPVDPVVAAFYKRNPDLAKGK